MSGGSALGGVIGAVAGFALGGPMGGLRGLSIGYQLGGMLDPPPGPHTEGPRLGDLSVQTATYGATIPRGYGYFPVSGNVFWLENNALSEVATTTESGGGKGGGGDGATSTTYAYYATFAVGLCQGPITGIGRIWVGNKLIYDGTATDIATIVASNDAFGNFAIYLGTDTQLADPRMQAAVGAANCPAYRGLAYLVFYDYPLADHGNSLLGAQVKVEILKSGTTQIPTHLASPAATDFYAGTEADLLVYENGIVYVGSFQGTLIPGGSAASAMQQYEEIGYNLDGTVRIPKTLYEATALGIGTDSSPIVRNWRGVNLFNSGTSPYKWVNILTASESTITSMPSWMVGTGASSDVRYLRVGSYLVGLVTRGSNNITFVRWPVSGNVPGPAYDLDLTIRTDRLAASAIGAIYADTLNQWVYLMYRKTGTSRWWLYKYDVDGNELDNWDVQASSTDSMAFVVSDDVLLTRPWIGVTAQTGNCYRLNADHTVTSIGVGFAGNSSDGYQSEIAATGLTGIAWWVGEVASLADIKVKGGVTLGSIVSAECLASNLLEAADIDVTELTQTVRGYRVGNVASIRSAFEQLQGIWPFDVVQSGYQIKFKARGSASVLSIPVADLDARQAGAAPGVQLTRSREMDIQLPRRVTVNFLDASREYDTGTAYDERLTTDAVTVRNLDIAIVMTAGEAAKVAQVLLYMYWLERTEYVSLRLPPTYLALEPADVVTLVTDSASIPLRLTSINYTSDGRLECTARPDEAPTYTATAEGEEGTTPTSAIAMAGPTDMLLLDLPVIVSEQDDFGFVLACGGIMDGWPGGVVYRSDDDGANWSRVQAFAPPGVTMGVATTILASHAGAMMDKAGVLDVSLYSGSLASITEAQLFAGRNWFAYGSAGRWEIIGAQTCVQQGNGQWRLTDLLRCRCGTESASSQHAGGDRVILLDAAAMVFSPAASGRIGVASLYRGITSGQTIDSAANVSFTYSGVNLRPLSPVYLKASRDPSNEWTISWTRRTRISGEWRSLTDVPLGEVSERYEIDVYSSSAFTTVLRTITATTTSATYTLAQQTTDFGGSTATLWLKIYQISDTVGRGEAATATLT